MRFRGGEVGPLARKAAKLMRYLKAGHTVDVDGNIYYLKLENDTAVNWKVIPVNDWTAMEFLALAENLEGSEYIKVMNFNKKKKEILS